jgi:LmbE family N-acetylglucosaminyl deacetylase
MRSVTRSMIIVPHQDDEMFLFHRLRALLHKGIEVHVAWVTDGAAHAEELRRDIGIRLFFPILARADNDTIRRVRENESTCLMHHLGIAPQRLTFLAYPSSRLHERFAALVEDLRQLCADLEPQEIYTVAYDHSHFEHDACNAAVKLAAPSQTTLYEFPVLSLAHGLGRYRWLAPHPRASTLRTPFAPSDERLRLRLFRRVFRSQWSVALLEQLSSLFPSDYRKLGEPYREIPRYDYTRPVPGLFPQYVPRTLSFEDFRQMVQPFLTKLGHHLDNGDENPPVYAYDRRRQPCRVAPLPETRGNGRPIKLLSLQGR